MTLTFEQIDPELCEDGRSVMLYGYTATGETFVAVVNLPMPTTEQAFLRDQWRDVGNVQWRYAG